MWTPQFGRIIEELLQAGVKVIGQDLILPTSMARYVPRHDTPYLAALSKAGADGRIVLSQAQHVLGSGQGQGQVISPFRGHIMGRSRRHRQPQVGQFRRLIPMG